MSSFILAFLFLFTAQGISTLSERPSAKKIVKKRIVKARVTRLHGINRIHGAKKNL